MSHYKSNVRDLEFNLFEVFGRGEVLGSGPYEDVDTDTAKAMLSEMATLAEGDLAASLVDSDRNPPVFDLETNSVKIPESFKKSYAAYQASGFWGVDVPAELGGTVVPPSLKWALGELVLGANPAVFMYAAGYSFAKILYMLGTDEQKKLAEYMVENHWGGTMVLTEPDAGSDVGAGRAKAVQQADGTWHITGVKRFITSAEHDMSSNILHFVLARPEGAGAGTKGLSLFVVPKYHVDLATGELGERNGAYVTNVEHKMGIKVSTTCEVTFGDKEPAVGTLLGDVHNGIAQMFRVIEHARMLVGTKAIATLSTGYLNALEYAKARVQGADMTDGAKDAPRVTITHHPDVRRSLMLQKSYAEGLRALVIFAATQQDIVDQEVLRTGSEEFDESSPAIMASKLNDLLLPIVKGVGSERAWTLLGTESLQTFGGSGFLQDYPVEQYVRDAKIDTLYEGTTAIQGLDFFFRKIVKDQFAALGALAEQILQTVKGGAGDDTLGRERELLGQAVDNVQGMVEHMGMTAMKAIQGEPQAAYTVGQNTTRLLLAAGDLTIGWLLVRQAEVAQARLDAGDAGKDQAFYQGKVAAAHFFTTTVLPRLAADRAVVEATDNALVELPEAAF
ncbi:acyl-CoA dehydrogenase [Allobranchiibius sp. GilTou73]|uniref:acyl-CoA dehydrogenase n=1 Tax=Allobranchiibius sp. GilTou73 TaxID=2904523 RepID=UPI001F330EE2|nr:acyl-CoA dehydrogenase [Allobranchiibius sp. GilTou73]UIJ35256.1 acyl-CoA dehydrogenase [Allobranchiibius sp. GilTou73]